MSTLAAPLPDLRADRPAAARAFSASSVWSGGLGVVLIGLSLASAVAGRLAYLAVPFDSDGAMFASIGRLVTEGGRFGDDLLDNKFPTVGLITGPFWRVFGSWWPGYVLAQFLLALCAALALARAAAGTFGPPAFAAVLLPCIVLLNYNALVFGGFQLETIQVFFACLAAACGLSALSSRDGRDALAAGLAAGCAMLLKPTGGAVLAALVCAWAVGLPARASLRLALSAALGTMFPLLAAALYLVESDQLGLIGPIAAQISAYAGGSAFTMDHLLRLAILAGFFGAGLLVRGWVYRRPAHRLPATAPAGAWALVVLWLVAETIGVVLQRRMYAYHFLPLVAPAVLIFAAIPRRTTPGQLAGVLALPVLGSLWGAHHTLVHGPPTWPAVAGWINAHTLPGERIWRDDTPQITLTTHARSASAVQLTFLFMNDDDAPARFSAKLLDDLRRQRPRCIVLPADVESYVSTRTRTVFELSRRPARAAAFARAWRDIDRFARRHYAPAATIGGETIWLRTTEAGP